MRRELLIINFGLDASKIGNVLLYAALNAK